MLVGRMKISSAILGILIIASSCIGFTLDTLRLKNGQQILGDIELTLASGVVFERVTSTKSETFFYNNLISVHADTGLVWQSSDNLSTSEEKLDTINRNNTPRLKQGLGMFLGIPQMGVGFSYFGFRGVEQLGWYGEFMITLSGVSGRDNFYDHSETWAGSTLGDSKVGDQSELTTLHIGRCYSFSQDLIGFLGAGLSINNHYAKYYDELEILSSDGNYFVNADDEGGISPGLVGGIIISVENPYVSGGTISVSVPPVSVQVGVVLGF